MANQGVWINGGTDAARPEPPGQGGDQVGEQNDQIAHCRIVAGRGILRNLGRNNNSPATSPGSTGMFMAKRGFGPPDP
jgi:hypothetical protein